MGFAWVERAFGRFLDRSGQSAAPRCHPPERLLAYFRLEHLFRTRQFDSLDAVDSFTDSVGRRPATWTIWNDWGGPGSGFPDGTLMNGLATRRITPLVFWQPTDPTTNRLQERIASMLGKEAALWLPSGTMANQVALRLLTRPGDEVIVSREAHALWHEAGGGAANAGVQLSEIGAHGVFTLEQFLEARKPQGHGLYPPTTLVQIENTHNRAGGVIFPQHEAERICAAAREQRIHSFLDGARLWNASIATQRAPAQPAPVRTHKDRHLPA